MQARRYAFKCHRKSDTGKDTVYPVNAIAFHPIHGTFASGGALRTLSAGSSHCEHLTYICLQGPSIFLCVCQ